VPRREETDPWMSDSSRTDSGNRTAPNCTQPHHWMADERGDFRKHGASRHVMVPGSVGVRGSSPLSSTCVTNKLGDRPPEFGPDRVRLDGLVEAVQFC
jgi:hypothetical protein